MNLFQASLSTGLFMVFLGLPLLLNHSFSSKYAKRFPRSKIAAFVTMILGTLCFLILHVGNLSDADFGMYKVHITIFSLLILGLSFKYLPDFLAVRGFCILVLLFSREALDAAFLKEPMSRLFMVSVVYIGIVAALYLSAWPYRLRDFLNWLLAKSTRTRTAGAFITSYGILLFALALSY
tara:strand:+ start:3195 stop:3734 length:540 start_codon:yes stop_codon:yes gene_type:complete